ncbi:glycosyltransferase [Leifsonia flava]|uniref:Glycosyl transferase family 28 C-terminal domain-containing protein n=1 Tax=Orlajensenia leifsoniae TaxID=2561933 RepID=A0A4Y9R599_9MICO|nr:glycosyltransferase [Leifsonia flava]TFV99814.1 hypothetical protein E4M00_00980 [Leifsonia flava]
MSRPRIAWYVHHHGRGHVGRLLAIAPYLGADVVCFSSLPTPDDLPDNCRWTQLERDDGVEPERALPGGDRDPTANGLLHWAPLLHDGHRRRLSVIAAALERHPVTAFVVDVSVEVTVFARLLGIPTVLITQPGRRDDAAHQLAFGLATKVIAPWPEELLRPDHLSAFPHVVYVGGISRHDGRGPESVERSGVLVLGGAGGSSVTASSIASAAAATSEHRWSALGMSGSRDWVADPWPDMAAADVVIAWAGQNSIADLAAVGARAVVIPQPRPFAEQADTADAVKRAGLAIVHPEWPEPAEWGRILDEARALQPDWARWRTRGAAERAAIEIAAVARGDAT